MSNSKSGSPSNANLSQLFSSARTEGNLSAAAAQTLVVKDIGVKIKAGLGTPVDNVTASEVLLVSNLIDDSGSMGGSEQALIDGYNNLVIGSLKDSKESNGILVHTRYLSDYILDPYTLIENAKAMDNSNYVASLGHTPLYDQSLVLLGTVVLKAQEFINNGVPARTITLLLTDGLNNSSRNSASDVAKIVSDMRASENHIIAAMGIGGNPNAFRQTFQEMGIEDRWILTPKNTPSEVRKCLQLFSRSAVRASQSAKSFSQTAGGGFAV